MKHWLVLIFALALCFQQSFAGEPQKDDTLDSFFEQQQLIDTISEDVDRADLPNLLVIRDTIGTVIEEVESNRQSKPKRKDITFETLVRIQTLVIQYFSNETLLGWNTPIAITSIYTEDKSAALGRLKELSEEMKVEYGFDKSFFTVITANIFLQIQKRLAEAENVTLDPQLKGSLRALWPPIGKVASIAKLGDRPKAYEAATPVIAQIRELYPMFDQVSSSSAGFPIVLKLKGLIEFYAWIAQQE